eukprot:COSAG06_NODE_22256_length_729_cov_1.747619_1_plen_243_part_11
MAIMQDLITGKEMQLNRKFKDVEQRTSYLDVIMASNRTDGIAMMNQGSRRYWFVEGNNNLAMGNSNDPAKVEYFRRLAQIVDSREGQLAIAHFYDTVDLDGFEPWNSASRPQTSLMKAENDMTQSTQQQFWRHCLEQGYIYRQFPSGCHEHDRDHLQDCDFVDEHHRQKASLQEVGWGTGTLDVEGAQPVLLPANVYRSYVHYCEHQLRQKPLPDELFWRQKKEGSEDLLDGPKLCIRTANPR